MQQLLRNYFLCLTQYVRRVSFAGQCVASQEQASQEQASQEQAA